MSDIIQYPMDKVFISYVLGSHGTLEAPSLARGDAITQRNNLLPGGTHCSKIIP